MLHWGANGIGVAGPFWSQAAATGFVATLAAAADALIIEIDCDEVVMIIVK